MLRKIIKIFILILIVGFFIYKYFLYFDFSNSCYITIKPSFTELSNSNIKQAIKVLKLTSPDEYDKLCSNVKTINPNIACGGFGGGCFYHSYEKEISVSTSNNSYLGWTAAIIVHETCHVVQNKEGRAMSELECNTLGNNVLGKIVQY